ncbi:helix-turn-helix domain-containing protein [Hoeflea ulvae]|uniref:AraC family transcriptional regulator n=1 Tax=Hoeflea ulvae TaxID=2983764 RepID=A0ABT3YL53_9HYPH|nr:AraC family transcriptional regulator [Hoeflea ulvae]MCY0096638.1 AraC family transcriptional regulator [Hoeflea ulvae]
MVNLPLAWLVSVLATIAAVALLTNGRMPLVVRMFFGVFLMALAAIGLLVGLRLSFAMTWLSLVQPLIALLLGPSAYLGFFALTQEHGEALKRPLAINAAIVVTAQLAMLASFPVSADIFVLAFNTVYLVRIAVFLGRDPDDFVHVSPQAMPVMRSALYATIALLGLMVVADFSIGAAILMAGDGQAMQLLSGAAGIMAAFCFAVALIVAPQVLRMPMAGAPRQHAQPAPSEDDRRLLAALDAMMEQTRLFSDNTLTLVRIARRMGVPARQISNAVNRCTDDNFSRYMNGYRIRHAQKLLRETDLPVTEIMLEAGFVSKSSFNGEFRRVTGVTPSQYRAGKPSA